MKIKVFKDGLDWLWECEEHKDNCYCTDWALAYEGALGHACMHHPLTRACKACGCDYILSAHCWWCG